MVGVRTCFSSAKASGKFKNHHLIVIIWHLKSSDFLLNTAKNFLRKPWLHSHATTHWQKNSTFHDLAGNWTVFSILRWKLTFGTNDYTWAHCVPTNFRLQIKNLTWIFSSKLAKYCTVINFTLYKIFQLYNFCLLWCQYFNLVLFVELELWIIFFIISIWRNSCNRVALLALIHGILWSSRGFFFSRPRDQHSVVFAMYQLKVESQLSFLNSLWLQVSQTVFNSIENPWTSLLNSLFNHN